MVEAPPRRSVELADIVRHSGPAYEASHAMSDEQRQALWSVAHCRTSVLGGHVEVCDDCGTIHISYNSCRNRHCPTCQGLAQETWVYEQSRHLLPISYFHVVFTLPHDLNDLTRFNKRACYDLLFKTATQTLQQFARNKWGGQFGITCVLHTWSQTLMEHVHLHCIVTGGVLTDDGKRFIRCPSGYLFPVKALGQVFRAKYVQGLYQLYRRNKLSFPGLLSQYAEDGAFLRYLGALPKKRWVVYSQGSFSNSEAVLSYLGGYTHRIAISNHRLLCFDGEQVTFRYKDNRDKDARGQGRHKPMRLPVGEFLRRFLSHVLPKGYFRIRHYGLHAPGNSRDKLSRCRELLNAPAPPEPKQPSMAELLYHLTGVDITRCPSCKRGKMVKRWSFAPGLSPPVYPAWLLHRHAKSA